jgi:hypothetical protein
MVAVLPPLVGSGAHRTRGYWQVTESGNHMQGSRIAAWAVTPALVGALSFAGAGAAFAAPNDRGNDSNHNSRHVGQDRQSNLRHVNYDQDRARHGRYTNRHEVNRHNQHIRQNNRDVVVVVIVFIQWDNDNNCWVYSQQREDGHGHYVGGEFAA